MRQAVLLSAVRTPIGRIGGSLAHLSARDLGGTAIAAAVERAGVEDPAAIDEVILGNVVSAGLGQNIARQCSLAAGLPASVGAMTVNKVCGASLKAVALAAQAIRADEGSLYVAGGVESMSGAPHLLRGRTARWKYGAQQIEDAIFTDGLQCATEGWAMGNAAELIAARYGLTREELDAWARRSHRRAIAASDSGAFDAEIVSVTRGAERIATDEGPRPDTSLAALAALRPAFTDDGIVTAGNSPGLNDAAAAMVVAAEEIAERWGLSPLARIVGFAQAALEPKWIFDAPAHAIPRLLERIGWTLDDVDLLEVNEAFAAQLLANAQALADRGWDSERVNVHGGAIALGHPLGATGARLLTTLVHALRARGGGRGIAALCLGGGEAVALAVEAPTP